MLIASVPDVKEGEPGVLKIIKVAYILRRARKLGDGQAYEGCRKRARKWRRKIIRLGFSYCG